MHLTAKLFYLLEVFWKRLDVMFVIYVYIIIFRTFDSLKIDYFLASSTSTIYIKYSNISKQ